MQKKSILNFLYFYVRHSIYQHLIKLPLEREMFLNQAFSRILTFFKVKLRFKFEGKVSKTDRKNILIFAQKYISISV